jgi:hypothetical protein
MPVIFMIAGAALFGVSVLTRSATLLAVTNLVIGVELERIQPPAGVIDITLGLLLLLVSWNRRRPRKRRSPEAAGTKSRAIRAALVRAMRDRAIPVPA